MVLTENEVAHWKNYGAHWTKNGFFGFFSCENVHKLLVTCMKQINKYINIIFMPFFTILKHLNEIEIEIRKGEIEIKTGWGNTLNR